MKPLHAVLVALFAFSSVASADPRLVVSTPSIFPESEIDIILDKPFVEVAALGQTVENHLVVIDPPIPGKLLWRAQNIARLVPDAPPPIATTFRFSLAPDQVHLDGSEVPTAAFATPSSEPLRIHTATQPDRWSGDYSRATSEWLVIFNDDIDPAKAGSFITFTSKSGQQVAASVRRPTFGDAGYLAATHRPWALRFPAASRETQPEDPATHALFAAPVSPLPVGEEWKISILKGLPNASATATLPEDSFYTIGTIEPFKIVSLDSIANPDEPRHLAIRLNYPPAELPADFLTRSITLTPTPADLTAEIDGSRILLHGDFSDRRQWTLEVRPPLTAATGYPLANSAKSDLKFEIIEPELALPSENQAQLATGLRTYPIHTVNLASLHVRIKQLDPADLVRAFQGYRHYTGNGHDWEAISPTAPLPYSLVSGKTILDREIPLGTAIDTSKEVTLDWNELLPTGLRNACLFLDITGAPHDGLDIGRQRNAQAIIQLTDIGLAWKLNRDTAFIYAFSCATGQPLPGVTVDLFGEDASPLASLKTDDQGLATLPRPAEARHLRATLGPDAYITAFDSSLNTVGLWHFPVRYSWNTPLESTRRAFLFTDRSLYRPGETVRLKGIVRTQRQNLIEAAAPSPARIVILDPAEKEIHTAPVTLSPQGSFDLSYNLPPVKTGSHTIRLEFPDDLRLAAETEDWYQQEALTSNATFDLPLRVEEFRRNAFEIKQTIADPAPGAPHLTAALSARYYQGQPVAAGAVSYFARVTPKNPYPERFRDFLFGNHRTEDWAYWYHYFGYRWEDEENGGNSREIAQHQGETTLTPEGDAAISVDIPVADFPTSREVAISAEVTDANNQTLRSTSTTTVHPASIYIGVSRLDRLVRTGEPVTLKIVATDTAGNPFPSPVPLTATLTREVNTAVKTRNDDGETVTRNDLSEETLSTAELTIDPAASAADGLDFTFTPSLNGRHLLTLRGLDPDGRPFATVTSFQVYGSDQYPWLYEDGMRIKLVSEKKSYRPGDTARILVLSPIEGTALVTLEREKVLRSFLTTLSASNPVIEIPITGDDAPNAYLSVLIVKGSAGSAREIKEPQLRLGYCELTVESDREKVLLTLHPGDTPAPSAAPVSYRPGDTVTLSGSATLADGSPAANAEITLYAEDEGTLAVMGYTTPAPHPFFYNPRLLEIDAGTSFHSFISEDRQNLGFYNKGFFVGGGGDLGALADLYRKNFDPCATWAPAILTDAAGKFTHAFTAPDTLTRYRLIAVATHGPSRFGHVESSVVVNKPLMLEPKAPRFAHQSDTFHPQVLVQNASTHAATWQITLATSGDAACRHLGPATRTITLDPSSSTTLAFPLVAEATGEAILHWKATPLSLAAGELTPDLARTLSDAVETRFPVHYPMPLLRQAEFVRLTGAGSANLLETLDPALLAGEGAIDIEFSRSPLAEISGSIDYLLHYPHGCVEQTTSSLMPWLALAPLRPIIPTLSSATPEKTLAAIQAGADRLLSMQLPDGSFSYWPGASETVPWATPYAGLGLILARQSGAAVPDSAIDSLTAHLIATLRGAADLKSAHELETHARTLWVLALAGKPQPSYQSLLVDRIADLTPAARSLLALAIARSTGDSSAAKAILTSTVPYRGHDDNWMRWHAGDALSLLAWSTIAPGSPEAVSRLDRLIHDRNPYGHWRTTWANGWSLLAVSEFAKSETASSTPVALTLSTHDTTREILLPPGAPAAPLHLPITPGLRLNLTHPSPVFVRLNLAAKPPIAPIQPVAANGLSIDRTYEKINPDGSAELLTEPGVGDLVRVTLRLTLPSDDNRYLVIEDPLPSLFEAINSDFKSQTAVNGGPTSENDWRVSHTELRDDRAVFYLDHIWRRGTYTLTYLARCTIAGQATAPPAKVEAMYDPETFALSPSHLFTADPRTPISPPDPE